VQRDVAQGAVGPGRTRSEAINRLGTALLDLRPSASLATRAMTLELDHPVYVCIHLALVELKGDVMVTADRRLLERLSGSRFGPLAEAL
jgi:predicted nucleic acid-binding protein